MADSECPPFLSPYEPSVGFSERGNPTRREPVANESTLATPSGSASGQFKKIDRRAATRPQRDRAIAMVSGDAADGDAVEGDPTSVPSFARAIDAVRRPQNGPLWGPKPHGLTWNSVSPYRFC